MHAGRVRGELAPFLSENDDISDPLGGSMAQHEEMAAQVEKLTRTLAGLLAGGAYGAVGPTPALARGWTSSAGSREPGAWPTPGLDSPMAALVVTAHEIPAIAADETGTTTTGHGPGGGEDPGDERIANQDDDDGEDSLVKGELTLKKNEEANTAFLLGAVRTALDEAREARAALQEAQETMREAARQLTEALPRATDAAPAVVPDAFTELGEKVAAVLRSAAAQASALRREAERYARDVRSQADADASALRERSEREASEVRGKAEDDSSALRAEALAAADMLRSEAELTLRQASDEARTLAAATAAEREAGCAEAAELRRTASAEVAALRDDADAYAKRTRQQAEADATHLRAEADRQGGDARRVAELQSREMLCRVAR